ncbi:hypothetical protein RhiirA1_481608, partial [Rhizophagus irregularis]
MLLSELAEKELIEMENGVRYGYLAETECVFDPKTGIIYGFELADQSAKIPFQKKKPAQTMFIPWEEIHLIDARLKSLAKKLSNENRTVYYKNETVWNEDLNRTAIDFEPNMVVLPIHPLPIHVPIVLGLKNSKIFAGKLNEEWQEILKGQEIHFYLQDESFIWKNAALTAEAFLSFFYNTKQAIYGKKYIITGFGRVAKMLAHAIK